MKRTLLLSSLCFLVWFCTPNNHITQDPDQPSGPEIVDPGQNQDPLANTSKTKAGDVEIMPLSELGAGEREENSHVGMISHSHLSFLRGTYVLLGENITGALPVYPRFVHTAEDEWLMFYHQGNSYTFAGNECSYLRSKDLINWTFDRKLFPAYDTFDQFGSSNIRMYAGAFPVQLSNGDILVVASTRMCNNHLNTHVDNGLAFRRSTDGGHTWSTEEFLNIGSNWEPFVNVLPSGKIQVYYTDEDHLVNGVIEGTDHGTGVGMIESDDNGTTWIPSGRDHHHVIRAVWGSNKAGTIYTDQMAAVIKLNGTNQLMAATEGKFQPSLSATYYISLMWSDEDGDWGTLNSSGEGPSVRKNCVFPGCAPFLVAFPSGETVLSFNNTSEDLFYMTVGNEKGEDFETPWPVFEGAGYRAGAGFWGTIFRIDSYRILAAIGGLDKRIQLGQYYLNHALRASALTPMVDGSGKDWTNNKEALCIGDNASVATLRAATSADSLYFLMERTDKSLSGNKMTDIYVADASEESISTSSLRLRMSVSGLTSVCRYQNGAWKDAKVGANARVLYQQGIGFVTEIALPKNQAPIKNRQLLLNLAFSGWSEESIVPVSDNTTEWIPLLDL